jgi:hypothetical protein
MTYFAKNHIISNIAIFGETFKKSENVSVIQTVSRKFADSSDCAIRNEKFKNQILTVNKEVL